MKLKEVLQKEILLVTPNNEEMRHLHDSLQKVIEALTEEIQLHKIKADVFVGGSLAKGTLIKREEYDVDIFVRFNRGGDLSGILEKMVEKTSKKHHWRFQKLHGSRDYFRIFHRKIIFEIIPVLYIKNVKEAENITDLSAFHVFYMRKKIEQRKRLGDHIRLAKQFCFGQNCYGAESYIRGFSGYALELLVSYYGSFLRFLKAASQSKEKIILDPEHYYKSKQTILQEMNEAKLQSPLVFVDPVHKERNALAALSAETFLRFQEACKRFLKRPSLKFFELKRIDAQQLQKEAKRKKASFIAFEIVTNRQEGDIAGTKLLKFSHFLTEKYEKYFDLLRQEFSYDGERKARLYLIVRRKKEILMKGPPVTSLENLKKFKKRHFAIFFKNGVAYAREKGIAPEAFFILFKKKQKLAMKDMGIIRIRSI